MKFVKLSIIALLMPVCLLACKKDSKAASPVEGKWSGVYGNDNDIPTILYKLNIKPGGIIEEINAAGEVKGTGTWSLKGNTFVAHYQWKAPLNTFFTIAATFDPATNKLTGTWGFDNSATDGGKWEVIKTN